VLVSDGTDGTVGFVKGGGEGDGTELGVARLNL